MIKRAVSEFLDKLWINFLIILIFAITILLCGSLFENYSVKQSSYNAIMNNVSDDSILLGGLYDNETLYSLEKYGKPCVNHIYYCRINETQNVIKIIAYPDEISSKIEPRLDSGKPINKYDNDDDNQILVYISHNPYGIKANETYDVEMIADNMSNNVKKTFRIAGILQDGQKIYSMDEKSREFNYTDMFSIYSYEQEEELIIITTQTQMRKITGFNNYYCSDGIFTFYEEIEDLEKDRIKTELIEYEKKKYQGISFIQSVFPETSDFIYKSKEIYTNEISTIFPIFIVIILISISSFISILTVKVGTNLKTYALYELCGMKNKNVLKLCIAEIFIDYFFAILIVCCFISVILKWFILYEINLKLDLGLCIIMCVYGCIIFLSTFVVAYLITKKNTIVKILKNG